MPLGAGTIATLLLSALTSSFHADIAGMHAGGVVTGQSALLVLVTARDFRWHIRYPGPDGVIETLDDVLTQRHLHLPERSTITVDLRSDDYVYMFLVPDFDVAEMAVPDKPYLFSFKTEAAGRHRLLGNQLCGFTHPELIGEVLVDSAPDFQRWLEQAGTAGAAPP